MTYLTTKPHLLLDVDGVLNVLAGIPDEKLSERGMERAYMEATCLPGGNGNRVEHHGWRSPEQREAHKRRWDDYRNLTDEEYAEKHGENNIPESQIFVITWSSDLPAMVEQLSEKFSLTWATTWEGAANKYLSPLMGLPTDLPYISFEDLRPKLSSNLYAKTPSVIEWSAGEPFLWLDDQVGRADQEAIEEMWERLNPGVPCKQVAQYIDRRVGITWNTVKLALAWAEGI